MKRLLLDTHALLWWLSGDSGLGAEAKAAIADPRNEIYVSAASTWEISIKRSLGKLTTPDDMDAIVDDEGLVIVTSDEKIALYTVRILDARK